MLNPSWGYNMSKVEYSPMALEDLQNIKEYITANWGEDISRKVLKKIIDNINSLEQFPASGTNLGKIINVPTDYRYLYTEKNYVFYHLESDKIQVVRVLNERQDFMQLLFGVSLDPNDEGY